MLDYLLLCCYGIECGCLVQDDEDAVLQGEKEAEKMIIEAYSALLLAFLSTDRLVKSFGISF